MWQSRSLPLSGCCEQCLSAAGFLSAFAAALIVFTATIYCRYHYAADGLASFAITVAVSGETLEILDRNA